MNKTKSFLLAVAVAATAFILSCTSDDGGGPSSNSNISTCGGNEYDTTVYSCKDGELVGSCRGERYYPGYEYCDNGVIKDLSSSSGGKSSSSVAPSSNSIEPSSSSAVPSSSSAVSSSSSVEPSSSSAGPSSSSIPLSNSSSSLTLVSSSSSEIAGRLYYLQSRDGTIFDLEQTKDYCQVSGDILTCYGGIEINLKGGSVNVNFGAIKGLAAGTYRLYNNTTVLYSFTIADQGGESSSSVAPSSSSTAPSSSSALPSSSSVMLSSSSVTPSSSSSSFIVGDGSVSYGGQTYKTVNIGGQVWFAENLNYNASGSKCNGNELSNCAKYGRLYNWSTAMTVCPSGWHLPSQAEWNVMTAYIGGEDTEGKKLKAKSGWNNYEGVSGNGTDEYGFSALPGGSGNSDGAFSSVGSTGLWWSATGGNTAYRRGMSSAAEAAGWGNYDKSYLFSVRCLKN